MSNVKSEAVEKALIKGDLTLLSTSERMWYVKALAERLGLDLMFTPFSFLVTDDGRTTIYVKKEATEQLRKKHNISIRIKSRTITDEYADVVVEAEMPIMIDGQVVIKHDEASGHVPFVLRSKGKLETADPFVKSNLIMKAETKAKRRVTLSICGLGWLDESEIDSVPGAKTAPILLESASKEEQELLKKTIS